MLKFLVYSNSTATIKTLISSVIASISITLFWKITLFLDWQIIQIVACQIIQRPLQILLLVPSLLQHFQCTNKLGGVIKENSNHVITVAQILFIILQCKNKWFEDSFSLSHNTHNKVPSGSKIFHLMRFILVGILSRSFQEKTPFSMKSNFFKYTQILSSHLHSNFPPTLTNSLASYNKT